MGQNWLRSLPKYLGVTWVVLGYLERSGAICGGFGGYFGPVLGEIGRVGWESGAVEGVQNENGLPDPQKILPVDGASFGIIDYDCQIKLISL